MDKNKIVVDPIDFSNFINKSQKDIKASVQNDGSIKIEEKSILLKNFLKNIKELKNM